jgi:hypothetical protein
MTTVVYEVIDRSAERNPLFEDESVAVAYADHFGPDVDVVERRPIPKRVALRDGLVDPSEVDDR